MRWSSSNGSATGTSRLPLCPEVAGLREGVAGLSMDPTLLGLHPIPHVATAAVPSNGLETTHS